jgi:hypothetical protein
VTENQIKGRILKLVPFDGPSAVRNHIIRSSGFRFIRFERRRSRKIVEGERSTDERKMRDRSKLRGRMKQEDAEETEDSIDSSLLTPLPPVGWSCPALGSGTRRKFPRPWSDDMLMGGACVCLDRIRCVCQNHEMHESNGQCFFVSRDPNFVAQ